MSDIDIKFSWWDLVLFSPVIGWPGLIIGLIAGAALAPRIWKKWRIVSALCGALAGNLVWAFGVIYLH